MGGGGGAIAHLRRFAEFRRMSCRGRALQEKVGLRVVFDNNTLTCHFPRMSFEINYNKRTWCSIRELLQREVVRALRLIDFLWLGFIVSPR